MRLARHSWIGNARRYGFGIGRVLVLLVILSLQQQPVAAGKATEGTSPPMTVSSGSQVSQPGAGLCAIRTVSGGTEGSPAAEETVYVPCADSVSPEMPALNLFEPLAVPPAPILLSPANNSSLNTLIPIKNIDAQLSGVQISPRIDISTDPTFQWIDYYTIYCGWTERYYEHRQIWNLQPNTRYYWRARTAYGNACGVSSPNWGPGSSVWSFYLTSVGTILPGPALISPPNGSGVPGQRPTFSWEPMSGRQGWQLWYKDITANESGVPSGGTAPKPATHWGGISHWATNTNGGFNSGIVTPGAMSRRTGDSPLPRALLLRAWTRVPSRQETSF